MKTWRNFFIWTVALGLAFLLACSHSALAGVYGSNGYGGCGYNQGCASASASPGSNSALAGSVAPIDLQTFGTSAIDAYVFSAKAGQTLHFLWQDASGFKAKHSLTVVSVQAGKVVITIQSKPQTFTLIDQQQKLVDLNADQQADVAVMVSSINPPSATIRLWRLKQPSTFAITTTASSPASQQGKSLHILQGVFAAAALILTLLSFVGAHKE